MNALRKPRPSMPEVVSSPDTGKGFPRKRIVAFGDSLTAGWYNLGRSFEPYAKSLVKNLPAEIPVDVHVCGLSGYSAGQMVDSLGQDNLRDNAGRKGKGLSLILQQLKPVDLVMIMAGTNDCGRQANPKEVVAAVKKLHAICHQAGSRTVLLSVPQSRQMCNVATARDRRYAVNDALLDWARERPPGLAMFIDTDTILPWSDKNPLWESDGLHFSRLGSQHFGAKLASRLQPLLGTKDLRQWQLTPPNKAAGPRAPPSHNEAELDVGCHIGFPGLEDDAGGPIDADEELTDGCHAFPAADAMPVRKGGVAAAGRDRRSISPDDLEGDEDDLVPGCHIGVPVLDGASPLRQRGFLAMGHGEEAGGNKHRPHGSPPKGDRRGRGLESDDEEAFNIGSDEDLPEITCHPSSSTTPHRMHLRKAEEVQAVPSKQKAPRTRSFSRHDFPGSPAGFLARLASWAIGGAEEQTESSSSTSKPAVAAAAAAAAAAFWWSTALFWGELLLQGAKPSTQQWRAWRCRSRSRKQSHCSSNGSCR
mmetsp:Transcript_28057/g.65177  ORF Transcript_28057/g.65177 Transcript_28057/m.65177 type:complete len:533 (-) Transcript_28057:1934-3532(-)